MDVKETVKKLKRRKAPGRINITPEMNIKPEEKGLVRYRKNFRNKRNINYNIDIEEG